MYNYIHNYLYIHVYIMLVTTIIEKSGLREFEREQGRMYRNIWTE